MAIRSKQQHGYKPKSSPSEEGGVRKKKKRLKSIWYFWNIRHPF